jgi:outer membrane lipoprotein LolB
LRRSFAPARGVAAVGRIVVAALVLAGCAPLAPAPESPPVDRAVLAAPFTAEGRISARRGADGVAGQFAWTHDGAHDRIALSSPLGQTIARLAGDGEGVQAEMSDGRVERAPDWDALTSRALGLPLPVGGLSAWLRGLPRDGTPHTLERDAQERPALLRQDGWEVGYAYADAAATRASRVTLRYPGTEPVEVRIVVDRWQ